MVRHLFLNELLSFLWMHVYKVQLWRHGSPERVNIPNVGLWWGYTKTKTEFKWPNSNSHFLIPQRADKHVMYFLMFYILTISPPGQILQNPRDKAPPQESFKLPKYTFPIPSAPSGAREPEAIYWSTFWKKKKITIKCCQWSWGFLLLIRLCFHDHA